MNKITPYLNSAKKNELKEQNQVKESFFLMNPSDETVNKILQYAATYKLEIVTKNEHIEYYLN